MNYGIILCFSKNSTASCKLAQLRRHESAREQGFATDHAKRKNLRALERLLRFQFSGFFLCPFYHFFKRYQLDFF
jgi:hypothetical protein